MNHTAGAAQGKQIIVNTEVDLTLAGQACRKTCQTSPCCHALSDQTVSPVMQSGTFLLLCRERENLRNSKGDCRSMTASRKEKPGKHLQKSRVMKVPEKMRLSFMSLGLSLTGISTFAGSMAALNFTGLLRIDLQSVTIPAAPVKVR